MQTTTLRLGNRDGNWSHLVYVPGVRPTDRPLTARLMLEVKCTLVSEDISSQNKLHDRRLTAHLPLWKTMTGSRPPDEGSGVFSILQARLVSDPQTRPYHRDTHCNSASGAVRIHFLSIMEMRFRARQAYRAPAKLCDRQHISRCITHPPGLHRASPAARRRYRDAQSSVGCLNSGVLPCSIQSRLHSNLRNLGCTHMLCHLRASSMHGC